MTFTFDLETQFKVTANLYLIPVYVKYEPDKTKEKECMLWTKISILTWSDLDLEHLFKVTAQLLTEGSLWVKYESDWI